MTDEFWERYLPESARQAGHLSHSIFMIGSLPGARRSTSSGVLGVACLEAWLVHMRLLSEFFGIHPAMGNRDFSSIDFGWQPPQVAHATEMDNWWTIASQHVVHLSRERTRAAWTEADAVDVSSESIRQASQRMLEIADAFVEYLEASNQPEAIVLRESLEQARHQLSLA